MLRHINELSVIKIMIMYKMVNDCCHIQNVQALILNVKVVFIYLVPIHHFSCFHFTTYNLAAFPLCTKDERLRNQYS